MRGASIAVGLRATAAPLFLKKDTLPTPKLRSRTRVSRASKPGGHASTRRDPELNLAWAGLPRQRDVRSAAPARSRPRDVRSEPLCKR